MFSSLAKQPLPVSPIKFSSFCLEKKFTYSSIFHSRKCDSIFTHLPTTRRYPDGEWKFSCADIARENKIARRKKTERTKRFRKRIDTGEKSIRNGWSVTIDGYGIYGSIRESSSPTKCSNSGHLILRRSTCTSTLEKSRQTWSMLRQWMTIDDPTPFLRNKRSSCFLESTLR